MARSEERAVSSVPAYQGVSRGAPPSAQFQICSVSLLGWCWMSNHVHLIAVPRSEGSLSRLVMRAHSRYAQEFNRRHKRCGHVWHSRFYSCPLGPGHLQAALRYVDLNPVRAGIVEKAENYRWSSAEGHLGGADATGLPSLAFGARLRRPRG